MTTLSQILSLARSGSPARAWDLFAQSSWDESDPKALTLKGRLLKDQAKAAQKAHHAAKAMQLYEQAANAYEQAALLKSDSYPLINAASLALLSGKPKRASELASQVIALIENNPHEGENAYWRSATYAEALLLKGDEIKARAMLAEAIAKLPNAWEDHAATIGQFETILTEQGKNCDWLKRHRPPCSVHYSGIIRLQDDGITSDIDNYIQTIKPSFFCGSLAAGSDILCAQSFLRYREIHNPLAELHIILPFPIDEFCQLSITPFGQNWVKDFQSIIEQADTVTEMGLDNPPHHLAVAMADKIAMGQVLRNARNLRSSAKALTIKGRGEKLRPEIAAWQQEEYDLTQLDANRKSGDKGAFTSKDNGKKLQILLWFNGADIVQNDNDILKAHEDGHYWVGDNLEQAYEIAQSFMSDRCKIGCIFDIMHIPTSDMIGRAKAIASISKPHGVSCDYNSAMAYEFANIAQSIEEFGALKTPWGMQSLWRIL